MGLNNNNKKTSAFRYILTNGHNYSVEVTMCRRARRAEVPINPWPSTEASDLKCDLFLDKNKSGMTLEVTCYLSPDTWFNTYP